MQTEDQIGTEPDKEKIEFELREKRLGLIYKILYVSVAVWISLMLSFIRNVDIKSAPVYCALLSLITIFILCIGRYVFGELRCLQVSTVVDRKLKDTADARFSDIWSSIGFYAICTGIFMYIQILLPGAFTQTLVMIYFFAGGVVSGVSSYIRDDHTRVYVNNICCMLACYSFYVLCQIINKAT